MRLALLLLMLSACKTSKSASADSALAVHEEEKLTDTESKRVDEDKKSTSVTVQQPTRIEVEDFAPAPDGGVTLRRRTVRILGVRETSTGVDRSFVASSIGTKGAETETDLAAKSHDEHASKSAPALSCAFGGWLWGAAIIFGSAALLWRLRPPWLDWLWKLLGRKAAP